MLVMTPDTIANHVKMDGIVTSVLRTGFFVDCGSLQAFVGRRVSLPVLASTQPPANKATDDSRRNQVRRERHPPAVDRRWRAGHREGYEHSHQNQRSEV